MEYVGYVCFGAGEKSKYVRKLLEEHTNIKIDYYVEDQAFSKIGTTLDGLEVISIYGLKKQYENGTIAGVIISTAYHKRTVEDMVRSCVGIGIKDEDIYLVRHNTLISGTEAGKEWIVPYKECVQVFDVNIHIVDHCNMKCELCSHNSQLVDGEVFADFNEFCRDLDRLCELVPNIQRITLLGGEPFLHPELDKFLDYSRKVYPYSEITLMTNGILLRKSSDTLLESLRKNKIVLVISLYPPMHEQMDDLVSYIRQNRIEASINRVRRFYKTFNENPVYNPKEMSACCGYCHALRHGNIYRCVPAAFVGYFNQKYDTAFPDAEGIDIYDETLGPLELVQRLDQPLELCRYCGSKYASNTFKWKQFSANTKKEDILIR